VPAHGNIADAPCVSAGQANRREPRIVALKHRCAMKYCGMKYMDGHPAGRVVLVVEDDWLLRHAIVCELEEAGWSVLEAGTGQGAIALLEQGRHFDLLITDIHLADALTGWDVAEAVRATAADVPVVYASGNPSIATRRVSGSVFLSKPFAISELVDISRSIVGG
jgi:CheY-like chemotaxis protein